MPPPLFIYPSGVFFTFPQCRSGRAREGFMGEVIFELGDVFIEVGSEAFCWEGNKEQKEGQRPPRRGVRLCTCHGCSGGDGSEIREQQLRVLLG